MNKNLFSSFQTILVGITFAALLSLSIAFIGTQRAEAIECNGTLTSEDCPHVDAGSFTGNFQVAIGSVGMFPGQSTGSFTLNVPACAAGPASIVQASAYWALRDWDDPNFWDENVSIEQNSNGAVAIAADQRYKSAPDIGHGSTYHADITATGIVTPGSHTYTITGLDVSPGAVDLNTSQWGYGISVVYECSEFPEVTIHQKAGHDAHWYGWTQPWAANRSELMCESFSASALPRTAEINMFTPGSVDPTTRQSDLWYKTGVGPEPSPTAYDLLVDVNTPANGGIVHERMFIGGTAEMDDYTTTVTIPAGDTYLCFQTDSSFQVGEHPDDAAVSGASMIAGSGWFVIPSAVDLSLGNLVWEDTNNNGVVDGAEAGIDSVTVHLYQDVGGDGKYVVGDEGTTPLQTQVTSSGGQYLFTGLNPGDYIVVIPDSNMQAGQPLDGFITSTGTNGSATGAYEVAPDPDNNIDTDDNGYLIDGVGVVACAVTLADNTEPTNDGDTDNNSNLSVDFGFFQQAKLGDYVWYDTNNDGIQDGGEDGVEGVTAMLYDANTETVIATQVTDANGFYQFCYLAAGDYYVMFSDLPEDYTFTSDNTTGETSDSDAVPSTGKTPVYSLSAGQILSDVDGGIFDPPEELAPTGIEVLGVTGIGVVVTSVAVGLIALQKTTFFSSIYKS